MTTKQTVSLFQVTFALNVPQETVDRIVDKIKVLTANILDDENENDEVISQLDYIELINIDATSTAEFSTEITKMKLKQEAAQTKADNAKNN